MDLNGVIQFIVSRVTADPIFAAILSLLLLAVAGFVAVMATAIVRKFWADPIADQAVAILKPRYREWSLVPAGKDNLESVRTAINRYLDDKILNTDTMARFHAVRPNDYLFLRRAITPDRVDFDYGVAIIHPLKAAYGKRFEQGKLVGKDLEPHMLKAKGKATYFYISFAEADEGYEGELVEKVTEHIFAMANFPCCIMTRPTTTRALHLVTRRGFQPCNRDIKALAPRVTSFKWVTSPSS
jgi:hypothetical protein